MPRPLEAAQNEVKSIHLLQNALTGEHPSVRPHIRYAQSNAPLSLPLQHASSSRAVSSCDPRPPPSCLTPRVFVGRGGQHSRGMATVSYRQYRDEEGTRLTHQLSAAYLLSALVLQTC